MLICIHMISWWLSSRSSTICMLCFRSLRTVIATLPPLRSGLGLWYQGSYSSSAGGFPFVSAIDTMWLFWLSAAACGLVILPLAPFTLVYSVLIWLCFFFPGSFLLFVVVGFVGLVPYGTVHGCCCVAACYLVSVEWASAPRVGCCASLWLASFFISGLSAGAWDRSLAFLVCFGFWFPVGRVTIVSHFAVSLVVVSAFCVLSYFSFLLLLCSTIVVHGSAKWSLGKLSANHGAPYPLLQKIPSPPPWGPTSSDTWLCRYYSSWIVMVKRWWDMYKTDLGYLTNDSMVRFIPFPKPNMQ